MNQFRIIRLAGAAPAPNGKRRPIGVPCLCHQTGYCPAHGTYEPVPTTIEPLYEPDFRLDGDEERPIHSTGARR